MNNQFQPYSDTTNFSSFKESTTSLKNYISPNFGNNVSSNEQYLKNLNSIMSSSTSDMPRLHDHEMVPMFLAISTARIKNKIANNNREFKKKYNYVNFPKC
jgi:hypothetical protein